MQLVLYPDPVLKKQARPIEEVTQEIRVAAAEMLQIMYAEQGVGLAAPQVGWSVRLFVINPLGKDQPEGERVFINPRVLSESGESTEEEGCLSIPDVRGKVTRAAQVSIEAQGPNGAVFRQDLDGLTARIFQHEYDHLDGILFISRLGLAGKAAARKHLKRLEKEYKEKQAAAAMDRRRKASRRGV